MSSTVLMKMGLAEDEVRIHRFLDPHRLQLKCSGHVVRRGEMGFTGFKAWIVPRGWEVQARDTHMGDGMDYAGRRGCVGLVPSRGKAGVMIGGLGSVELGDFWGVRHGSSPDARVFSSGIRIIPKETMEQT
jgi:hypothetical protein